MSSSSVIHGGEKVGRNDPCPCGSNKKYKTCCWAEHQSKGIKVRKHPPDALPELKAETDKKNASDSLLLEKIGYYISHLQAVHNGQRTRALYSRIFFRRVDETFHEFIIWVLGATMGNAWGKEQEKLPPDKRHFIAQCYEKYREFLIKNKDEEVKLRTGRYFADTDGYAQWILSLAFDIYCLQHTKHLPEFLLRRLRKNGEEFQGARYEIAVASVFARAGFSIDFLDENKPEFKGMKHPEFIARLPENNIQIAVEAKSKRREGILHTSGKAQDEEHLKGNIRSLLSDAMKKEVGSLPYMIFIDINAPHSPAQDITKKKWIKDIFDVVAKEIPSGIPAKDTGMFLTNFSYHYQRENRAEPGEYMFSRSLNPQHPVPDLVWERLINVLHHCGEVHDLDLFLESGGLAI
ncbi:MAG: SEC-C metal-binding domain-containing protein [Patescibacteria group bacterium]